jgi:hypothetical protein
VADVQAEPREDTVDPDGRRHFIYQASFIGSPKTYPYCRQCNEPWPCVVERLTRDLEAAQQKANACIGDCENRLIDAFDDAVGLRAELEAARQQIARLEEQAKRQASLLALPEVEQQEMARLYIADWQELRTDLHAARARLAAAERVVEAARFADNCIDDDDPVTTHNNGPGACLWDMHKALVAFDK